VRRPYRINVETGKAPRPTHTSSRSTRAMSGMSLLVVIARYRPAALCRDRGPADIQRRHHRNRHRILPSGPHDDSTKQLSSLNPGSYYFRRSRASTGHAPARLLPPGGSVISERIFSDPLSRQEGVQDERHGKDDPENPQRSETHKNQCHEDEAHPSRSIVVDTPPGSSYSRFLCFTEVIQHGAPKCISSNASAYPALVSVDVVHQRPGIRAPAPERMREAT
jgi:hypothetical protein